MSKLSAQLGRDEAFRDEIKARDPVDTAQRLDLVTKYVIEQQCDGLRNDVEQFDEEFHRRRGLRADCKAIGGAERLRDHLAKEEDEGDGDEYGRVLGHKLIEEDWHRLHRERVEQQQGHK